MKVEEGWRDEEGGKRCGGRRKEWEINEHVLANQSV